MCVNQGRYHIFQTEQLILHDKQHGQTTVTSRNISLTYNMNFKNIILSELSQSQKV